MIELLEMKQPRRNARAAVEREGLSLPELKIHFGMCGATFIATATPFEIHQVGSVLSFRVCADCFLEMAFLAEYLTLGQLFVSSFL